MEKLISWWQGYEPREQVVLGAVGGAFVLFLLFLLVFAPLIDWHAKEKKNLVREQELLVDVKRLVAQIKAKGKDNQSQGQQSLSVLIDNSLRENQLVMRGFQPGANRDARLRLDNAAYPALMQWLHDLEYRHKLSILDLSLTPARAPGHLMVNVRVGQ